MTQEQALDFFRKAEALLSGHFLLTSGKHSASYFQCAKVLQYPDYTRQICLNISDYFRHIPVDGVIAPAMGGIIVGYEVARQLNKKFIFAEREDGVFKLRRGFDIKAGENYLVCEDVVTTGGSVMEVINIVKDAGAKLAGVGFLVDRSNGKVQFGVPQIGAVQIEVIAFDSHVCPLCKKGEPLVKPGSRKFTQ
ncbi:MAG: orotate phosphoribosyltransferase [Ignavibacteriaceae bacterium]|nr:orotate phosphoribosyltransferase [Ignavibacteriaceae bacterium]